MDKFIQPVLYRHRLVDRESFSRRDFYVSFMQILTAAALILLILTFIFCPIRIQQTSMLPNYRNNQYVFYFSTRDVKAGDVVILYNEEKLENNIIKRIIATEGQTVSIKNGADGYAHVYVNGDLCDESYINGKMYAVSGEYRITLKENEIFVLGDNRNVSKDSRAYGPFKITDIKGKVIWKTPFYYREKGIFRIGIGE